MLIVLKIGMLDISFLPAEQFGTAMDFFCFSKKSVIEEEKMSIKSLFNNKYLKTDLQSSD